MRRDSFEPRLICESALSVALTFDLARSGALTIPQLADSGHPYRTFLMLPENVTVPSPN